MSSMSPQEGQTSAEAKARQEATSLDHFYYERLKGNLVEAIDGIMDQDGIDPGFRSLMLRRAVTAEPNEFLKFLDRLNTLIKKGELVCNDETIKLLKKINDITFDNKVTSTIQNTYSREMLEMAALKPEEEEPPPSFKIVEKAAAKFLLYPESDKEVNKELCRNIVQKIAAEKLVEFDRTEEGLDTLLNNAKSKESLTAPDSSWRTETSDVMVLNAEWMLDPDELNQLDTLKSNLKDGKLSWQAAILSGRIHDPVYEKISPYGLNLRKEPQIEGSYNLDDSGVQSKVQAMLAREESIRNFQEHPTFKAAISKHEALNTRAEAVYIDQNKKIGDLYDLYAEKGKEIPAFARQIAIQEKDFKKQIAAAEAARQIKYGADFDLEKLATDIKMMEKNLTEIQDASKEIRQRKAELFQTIKQAAKEQAIEITDDEIEKFPAVQEVTETENNILKRTSVLRELHDFLSTQKENIEKIVTTKRKAALTLSEDVSFQDARKVYEAFQNESQSKLTKVAQTVNSLDREYRALSSICDKLTEKIAEITKNRDLEDKASEISEQIKMGSAFDLESFKNDIDKISTVQDEITSTIEEIQTKRDEFIAKVKEAAKKKEVEIEDEDLEALPIVRDLIKKENELIEKAKQLGEYQNAAQEFVGEIEKSIGWKSQIDDLLSPSIDIILKNDFLDVGTKSILLQNAVSMPPSEFRSYLDHLYSDLKDKGEQGIVLMKHLKKIHDIHWNNPNQESTTLFHSQNDYLVTAAPILQKAVHDVYGIDQETSQNFVKNRVADVVAQLESSIEAKMLSEQQSARHNYEATLTSNTEWRKKAEINPQTQKPIMLSHGYGGTGRQVTIAGSIVYEYGPYLNWNAEDRTKSYYTFYQNPSEPPLTDKQKNDQKKDLKLEVVFVTGPNPHWSGGHISEFSLPLDAQNEVPAKIDLAKPFEPITQLENSTDERKKIVEFETDAQVQNLYKQFSVVLQHRKEEQDSSLSEISALNEQQANYDIDTAKALRSQYAIRRESEPDKNQQDFLDKRLKELDDIINKLTQVPLHEIDDTALKDGVQKMNAAANKYATATDKFKDELHQFRTELLSLANERGLSYKEISHLDKFNEVMEKSKPILTDRGLAREKYSAATQFISKVNKFKPIGKGISNIHKDLTSTLAQDKEKIASISTNILALIKEQQDELNTLKSIAPKDITSNMLKSLEERAKKIDNLESDYIELTDKSADSIKQYKDKLITFLNENIKNMSFDNYKDVLDYETPNLPSFIALDTPIQEFSKYSAKTFDTNLINSETRSFIKNTKQIHAELKGKLDSVTALRKKLFTLGNNLTQALTDEFNRVSNLGLQKQAENAPYIKAIENGLKEFSAYTTLDKIPKNKTEVIKAYAKFEHTLDNCRKEMEPIPLYRKGPLARVMDWIKRACSRENSKLKLLSQEAKGELTKTLEHDSFKPFTSHFEQEKKNLIAEKEAQAVLTSKISASHEKGGFLRFSSKKNIANEVEFLNQLKASLSKDVSFSGQDGVQKKAQYLLTATELVKKYLKEANNLNAKDAKTFDSEITKLTGLIDKSAPPPSTAELESYLGKTAQMPGGNRALVDKCHELIIKEKLTNPSIPGPKRLGDNT